MALVCAHCKNVVARTDRGLEAGGRVADVVFSDTSLAPMDHGTFRGRAFEVHGRLVLQHPAGGTWEEYYALFDGRYPGWISEAQGRWYVMQEVVVAVPPEEQLPPGTALPLGTYGQFVVRERNVGHFLSAEGELPFAARPGAPRSFVDLEATGELAASVDYSPDGPPKVYLGVVTTFDQLAVVPRGGPRPEQKVGLAQIQCPNCGAPLPMRAAGKSERVACTYCGALSDLATHRVIAQQDKDRAKPRIPLGSTGTLEGVAWTVIGFMQRSTEIEGERFGWEEFLLYEASAGYRWLVLDEGIYRFCTPLSAADVGTARAPQSIEYGGNSYRVRNSSVARVDYVLGEVYWRVEVGETVEATDYERGRIVVSREASADEVNWTLGAPLPERAVAQAFGLEGSSRPDEARWSGDDRSGGTKADDGLAASIPKTPLFRPRTVLILLATLLLFVFFVVAALGAEEDDDDDGNVRGSSLGGFGGK
jgi:hypothetical protein